MKHDYLIPIFTKFIPEQLEQGKIYISKEFGSAIHLCACGCGNKAVTPFDNPYYSWILTDDNGKISLSPSIGNFSFSCKSHYYLKENRIEWL